MNPFVTVVIPFFNDPYVDQAIQSVLSQTYDRIEIIVVDDGSTQHAERLAPYHSRIYYLGKANGGTASALNHGIRYSSGEYVAWLSSDDVFYPDKIQKQISFMLEQGAWISHTNFDSINSNGQITAHRAGCVFSNMLDFYRCFFQGNPVNGCTVMIRKELFCHIGLFNESLPFTHDLDFWRRVIEAGISFPFLDEALVGYRWHDSMGTVKHQPVIQQELTVTQHQVRSSLGRIVTAMSS